MCLHESDPPTRSWAGSLVLRDCGAEPAQMGSSKFSGGSTHPVAAACSLACYGCHIHTTQYTLVWTVRAVVRAVVTGVARRGASSCPSTTSALSLPP